MRKKPVIVAISGVKNSGKTTFIEKMLPLLNESGIKTAVIKHDGHRFEADPIQTDTGRYMHAGAYAASVFDGEKFKIIRKESVDEHRLIEDFPDADLILLEGFKRSHWPKIELVRGGNSFDYVSDKETMIGLVTDLPIKMDDIPVVHLDDVQSAVELLFNYMKKSNMNSMEGL